MESLASSFNNLATLSFLFFSSAHLHTPRPHPIIPLVLLLLLVELGHVEALVNDLRDGLDLRAQLGLDPVQGEAVVVGDEVDGNAHVAKPAGATDAVEVGLRHLGEVEVDDHVHGLDVDTAGEQICEER